MQTNIKKLLFSTLIAIASVLTVSTIVIAAVSLVTPGAPNPAVGTMKTLEDIYQRVIAGTSATDHTLNPALGPTTGTMHTLTDIYNAIPTNDKVLHGTNGGTANTPPGSGDAATATQVLTGYYAFNAAGAVIPGSASAGAVLTWSTTQSNVTWNDAHLACSLLGNTYRLPTRAELETAINNQFVGPGSNPGDFQPITTYWASTEYDAMGAYGVWFNSEIGVADSNFAKTADFFARCVSEGVAQ